MSWLPGAAAARSGSLSKASRPGGLRLPSLGSEIARKRQLDALALAHEARAAPSPALGVSALPPSASLPPSSSALSVPPLPPRTAAPSGGADSAASPDASSSADPSSTSDSPRDAAGIARAILADLTREGRVHRETLAAVEATREWADYEGHVNFELNMLRLRYASTPNAPMTPARRAQMQAHARAKQSAVMEEHAGEAARKFVESLAPGEITALRDLVARLDPPGVGALVARGTDGDFFAGGDDEPSPAVSAEALKDALEQVGSALGAAAAAGKKRGGGGGTVGGTPGLR